SANGQTAKVAAEDLDAELDPSATLPLQSALDQTREAVETLLGSRVDSEVIQLSGGVTHRFEFVAEHASTVGDLVNLTTASPPETRLAILSEHAWLLEHVDSAPGRRFL